MNENNHPFKLVRLTGKAPAIVDGNRELSVLQRVGAGSTAALALPAMGSRRPVRLSLPAKAGAHTRPRVLGKFIFVGDEKLYVRGVTYGTFRPNDEGEEFPAPPVVERDFKQMAANGVNAVRTYPPPLWLLHAAQRRGLRILAGLPVERSVAFLDYRKCARSIEEMVRT